MLVTIENAKAIAAAGEELRVARAWAKRVRTASKVQVSIEVEKPGYRDTEKVMVLDQSAKAETAAIVLNRIILLADQRVAEAERKLRRLGAVVPD